MTAAPSMEMLRLTLPVVLVGLTALLALVLDLTVLRGSSVQRRMRGGVALGCTGCLGAMTLLCRSHGHAALADGLFVAGSLTRLLQIALLTLTVFTLLLTASARFTRHAGEYVALILFATSAMMILVSTHNLLLIFVSLEFLSLSLYILTGFDKSSPRSSEAALKYFLFGGMSAGFLLFGISLLYGASGAFDLRHVALAANSPSPDPLFLVAIVMVVIGLGFKIAAAPFHLWAPDAYQGAPTQSAAFIASGSKVASFFVLSQVLLLGLAGAAGDAAAHNYQSGWAPVLAIVAALSIVLGNLAAIVQSSVRRLLAYSAVGHAGYMLITLVAHTPQSLDALIYYVITYAIAAVGAFGVLSALETEQVDSIESLAGLVKRAPGLSFCMLVFLLSLAGIPPLAGFFAKFYVFVAAFTAPDPFGLLWLVMLAIAASAVSLYYYLRVLKSIYVAPAAENAGAIDAPLLTRLALWLLAALVIVLGCVPNLLLSRIAATLH